MAKSGFSIWLGVAITLFLSGTASFAAGQEVFGRIWNRTDNRPLSNAVVTLKCGNQSFRTRTDSNGVYALQGPRKRDNCTITASVGGSSSTAFPVYVSAGRTRANLEIRRAGDRWLLIRK